MADGLLPNNFPDRSGEIPGYNTVDATLWYAGGDPHLHCGDQVIGG
ncbi:MAG: amylo-alpha-1,6-glucosidase [Chloroflexia bacterium]